MHLFCHVLNQIFPIEKFENFHSIANVSNLWVRQLNFLSLRNFNCQIYASWVRNYSSSTTRLKVFIEIEILYTRI